MQERQSSSSQICIIVDRVRAASPSEFGGILSGWQAEWLRNKALKAGLTSESFSVRLLADLPLSLLSEGSVSLGLGEDVLGRLAGKKSIDKWHLSPLKTAEGGLFLGTFDFGRMQKQFELGLYFELAICRAAEFARSGYQPIRENFRLNPGVEEAIAILKDLRNKDELSVDIETGYGQINTVGIAWSASEAVAINVLPDRCSDLSYYELWNTIREILESDSRKIFQNFIYDTSYFSAYGIKVRGEIFDTMHAMKILWPELDSNLGNVGRIYTKRPYWKDDGKITGAEGKKKDWGAVRDWHKHYTYSCRDTTGTLEASLGQREDLKARGLDLFYQERLQSLINPAREMCAAGIPLDLSQKENLKKTTGDRIEVLKTELQKEVGFPLNPRSPKQVQNYLKKLGVKLPKKYDKEKGVYRESADTSTIKKIRLKRPDLTFLAQLQEIKQLDKALSAYLNFEVRPDGRLSYSLNISGTETLRFSGGKDAWDRGFNIQTIPRDGDGPSIKSMFLAPEGYSFCEIDLRQAESRFVAYDSADKTLIDMLESGADVHTHVGEAILVQMGKDPKSIPRDEFKSTWRQLGKKAGHGLNYGMKAQVFVETVFNELDLVITRKDAEQITRAYFGLFPGIPRWHESIKRELYLKRRLKTPTGWERYFYGRPGPDMEKEGLAFRPQHTIPFLTNALMLHLCELRNWGKMKFQLLAQVHDSLILLAPDSEIEEITRVCLETRAGHPVIELPGGQCWIPREVKAGKRMSEMKEVKL